MNSPIHGDRALAVAKAKSGPNKRFIPGSAPCSRGASLSHCRAVLNEQPTSCNHVRRDERGNIAACAWYSVLRRRVMRDARHPKAASRPVHVRTARSATRVAESSPAASRDSTCLRSHAVPPLSDGSTANGRHNCKDGVACRRHAQDSGLLRDGAARLASCAAPRRCSPRSATTSGSHSSIASARVDRCPPCA